MTIRVSRYQKGKPIWILLKQETVSGSGIRWAICKSAPRSRQITMPAPHHSVFTGPTAFLPPNQQRQSTEGKMDDQIPKTSLGFVNGSHGFNETGTETRFSFDKWIVFSKTWTYSWGVAEQMFELNGAFLGVGKLVLEQVHLVGELLFVVVQLCVGQHHLLELLLHRISRHRRRRHARLHNIKCQLVFCTGPVCPTPVPQLLHFHSCSQLSDCCQVRGLWYGYPYL